MNNDALNDYTLDDYALDDLLGFGIFCETHVRRHGFVTSKQWHLHRTGNDKLDQIWIEYNDFLLSSGDAISSHQIRTAMWQSLLTSNSRSQNVDEYIVNVAESNSYNALKQSLFNQNHAHSFTFELDSKQLGFKTALTDSKIQDYPNKFSKSSFKQINKTRLELSKLGDLEIEYITNHDAAFECLNFAKTWHIDKWASSQTPSGFCNDAFIRFHKKLCEQNNNDQKVVCIVARLNNQVIGVNYIFIDATTAYFYLSCLKPQNNSRIKLGLLLHQESVKYAQFQNLNYYDFLAGQSRYKQQLSDITTEFACYTLRRKKASFVIESTLSKVKAYLVRN
ncbi:hypothetical protein GCM10027050_21530 [Psychrosphaera aestuarii]